jgi:transcriptional regulatory protein LEU3
LSLLDVNLQQEIIMSVSRLISILGSNDVALDGRHTPALYSRFLASLMFKHSLTMSDMLSSSPPLSSPCEPESRQSTPPEGFYWPDIRQPNLRSENNTPRLANDCALPYQGGLSMDFSLSHFVKIVIEHTPPTDMEVSTVTWETWKSEEEPAPIMWSDSQTTEQGIWAT